MAVQIEMPEPQSPTKHADGDGDDRKVHCRCVLNYTPHLRTVRCEQQLTRNNALGVPQPGGQGGVFC